MLHLSCSGFSREKIINFFFKTGSLPWSEICSFDKKAGDILTEQIGLLSPPTRCFAHAASGNIKQMSSSQPISMSEVVTFVERLQPIFKNFTFRATSSSLLNNALEIMEMKPIKIILWCPTKMANLIDCCLHTVNILILLCNTLVSRVIKK